MMARTYNSPRCVMFGKNKSGSLHRELLYLKMGPKWSYPPGQYDLFIRALRVRLYMEDMGWC